MFCRHSCLSSHNFVSIKTNLSRTQFCTDKHVIVDVLVRCTDTTGKGNCGHAHTNRLTKKEVDLSCGVHLTAGHPLSHTADRWRLRRQVRQKESNKESDENSLLDGFTKKKEKKEKRKKKKKNSPKERKKKSQHQVQQRAGAH